MNAQLVYYLTADQIAAYAASTPFPVVYVPFPANQIPLVSPAPITSSVDPKQITKVADVRPVAPRVLCRARLGSKRTLSVIKVGNVGAGAVEWFMDTPVVIPDGYTHEFEMDRILWTVNTRVCDSRAEFQMSTGNEKSEWVEYAASRKLLWKFVTSIVPGKLDERGFNVRLWLGVYYPTVQNFVRSNDKETYDALIARVAPQAPQPVAVTLKTVDQAETKKAKTEE